MQPLPQALSAPALSMWKPSNKGFNSAPDTNEPATSEPERGSQSSGGGVGFQVSDVGALAVPAFSAPASSLRFGGTVSTVATGSATFGHAPISASTGLTGRLGDGMLSVGPLQCQQLVQASHLGPQPAVQGPVMLQPMCQPAGSAATLFGGFGGFGAFGAASTAGTAPKPDGASSPASGSGFLGASGGFSGFGGFPFSAGSAAASSEPALGTAAAETPAKTASPIVFGLGGGAGIGSAQAESPSGFGTRPGSALGSRGRPR